MDRREFLGTTILGAGGVISGIPGRLSAAQALESRAGYIRHEQGRWVIGTSLVEKIVTLNNGQLALASFKNKVSGREYIQGGAVSNEVRLRADGQEITGGSGGWVLMGEDSHRLSQGELQLDLKFRHGPLVVTKHYVAYPGSSVIREWFSISNDSTSPVRLSDPGFLESRVLTADEPWHPGSRGCLEGGHRQQLGLLLRSLERWGLGCQSSDRFLFLRLQGQSQAKPSSSV